MVPDELLPTRARRAYELGRLSSQAGALLWAAPLVCFTLVMGHHSGWTWLNFLLLETAIVAMRWRGGDFGRAVVPGLVGGSLAFALPLLACQVSLCAVGPSPRLVFVCVGAGVLAGAVLTTRALTRESRSVTFIVSAGTVAALAAAMGCAMAGWAGIAGMLAGLALAGSPALALARAR